MPRLRSLLLAALLASVALPASAAPIARTVDLTLSVTFPFLRDFFAGPPPSGNPVTLSTPITPGVVQVDVSAGTIQIATGAVQRNTPLTAAVTGNTSIANLRVTTFGNLGATFAVGGAAAAGDTPCTSAGPGEGCVPQTGFGGAMGLTGTVFFEIIPNVISLPFGLSTLGIGLAGSAANTYFSVEAAPFTIGTGSVITGSGHVFQYAGEIDAGANRIRLVAPTYVAGSGVALAELEIVFTDGLGLPAFVSATVPEPATVALFCLGVLGLRATRRTARPY